MHGRLRSSATLSVALRRGHAAASPLLVEGDLTDRARASGAFLSYLGLVGGSLAFFIGGLLGVVLTLIDTAGFAVSRWIAPDLPAADMEGDAAPEEVPAEEVIDA